MFSTMKMKVPTMGDSITEGTIVEWAVQVGQQVNEGDVVCLIETDKVTVDIKAEVGGVIVSLFGSVDETVEVGSDLYQIEKTDSKAIASDVTQRADSSTPEKPPLSLTPELPTESTVSSISYHRTPSIRFLGKAGWAERLHDTSKLIIDVAAPYNQVSQQYTHIQLVPDDISWNPTYGRPPITQKEIEALEMGGATDAPKLIKPSIGATFE